MVPGEYLLAAEPITLNAGRRTVSVEVTNRGDRPIQVGSHCHFFEVNRALSFDRRLAYGMRLNVLAGSAVRFEPGDTRAIELVALAGRRRVTGLNALVQGALDDDRVRRAALESVDLFARQGGHPGTGRR